MVNTKTKIRERPRSRKDQDQGKTKNKIRERPRSRKDQDQGKTFMFNFDNFGEKFLYSINFINNLNNILPGQRRVT